MRFAQSAPTWNIFYECPLIPRQMAAARGLSVDIIVSNRVAIPDPGEPVMGGLASALLPAVQKSGVVWFGSSGNVRKITVGSPPLVQVQSYGRGTIATVDLPQEHYAGFYEGYANSALWPLLHARPDLCVASTDTFAAYRAINAYMARTLVAFGGTDATYWIHDYHYLPLAEDMRALGVSRQIGLFIHTPWPEPAVFTRLPQYRELLHAMLCYDLIGFQTDQDRNNFAELLQHELHFPVGDFTFRTKSNTCRLATHPIGIDAARFSDNARKAIDNPDVQRLRKSISEATLMIGVDRIDYSKGLTSRMEAFDRFLTQHPAFKRRLSLLQIAVPSRTTIDTYRHLKRDLDTLIGEINGRHGEIDWTPIRYLNKGYCQASLAGFYRSAAVGLITPLRDGMNLVAKEYVAAQDPLNPGALILSKFAGAACQLEGALLVDPENTDELVRCIVKAAGMTRRERCERWQAMMDVLNANSIHTWFEQFLSNLKTAPHRSIPDTRTETRTTQRNRFGEVAIHT